MKNLKKLTSGMLSLSLVFASTGRISFAEQCASYNDEMCDWKENKKNQVNNLSEDLIELYSEISSVVRELSKSNCYEEQIRILSSKIEEAKTCIESCKSYMNYYANSQKEMTERIKLLNFEVDFFNQFIDFLVKCESLKNNNSDDHIVSEKILEVCDFFEEFGQIVDDCVKESFESHNNYNFLLNEKLNNAISFLEESELSSGDKCEVESLCYDLKKTFLQNLKNFFVEDTNIQEENPYANLEDLDLKPVTIQPTEIDWKSFAVPVDLTPIWGPPCTEEAVNVEPASNPYADLEDSYVANNPKNYPVYSENYQPIFSVEEASNPYANLEDSYVANNQKNYPVYSDNYQPTFSAEPASNPYADLDDEPQNDGYGTFEGSWSNANYCDPTNNYNYQQPTFGVQNNVAYNYQQPLFWPQQQHLCQQPAFGVQNSVDYNYQQPLFGQQAFSYGNAYYVGENQKVNDQQIVNAEPVSSPYDDDENQISKESLNVGNLAEGSDASKYSKKRNKFLTKSVVKNLCKNVFGAVKRLFSSLWNK